MKTTIKLLTAPLGNEDGFVLVVAMLMMVLLTSIGIAALNNTKTELRIAGNDREEKQVFYGTESGCSRGGQWLRNLQLAVIDDHVDSDLMADYITALNDNDNNQNQSMGIHNVSDNDESNLGDAAYPVKYSYGITETADSSNNRVNCEPIPGNSPGMLACYYDVACTSLTSTGGARIINMQVNKPTDFN